MDRGPPLPGLHAPRPGPAFRPIESETDETTRPPNSPHSLKDEVTERPSIHHGRDPTYRDAMADAALATCAMLGGRTAAWRRF